MAIATIAWDEATKDVALPIRLAQFPESLVIKLKQRCRFFLGEWFLNTLEGVPYYRDVLIKNPDLAVVRSIFRQLILTTPDIASVRSLTASIDVETRELTLEFIAVATDGTIIDTAKLDEPFIITIL